MPNRDQTGGYVMEHWHPASAGHVIDPRLRERIMDNPRLTVIMVHRAAMASSNPCWLILTSKGATVCSRFRIKGETDCVQMAPHVLGTTASAWLETYDEVIIETTDAGGVLWENWTPSGKWVP